MPRTPKSYENTYMITKKICVLLSFNHSFAYNFLLTKVILIQGAFKNIQGPLWKIQGLFIGIPQFFNFQGLAKARANHDF